MQHDGRVDRRIGPAVVSDDPDKPVHPPDIVYALASLTIIRMLPVNVSLARSGIDRPSIAFIGWFGPRGLTSVVFALLAIEQLGETTPEVQPAVATVALTILLSVALHGVTADPGGRQYI